MALVLSPPPSPTPFRTCIPCPSSLLLPPPARGLIFPSSTSPHTYRPRLVPDSTRSDSHIKPAAPGLARSWQGAPRWWTACSTPLISTAMTALPPLPPRCRPLGRLRGRRRRTRPSPRSSTASSAASSRRPASGGPPSHGPSSRSWRGGGRCDGAMGRRRRCNLGPRCFEESTRE